MTDRELLEAAARAAGYSAPWWGDWEASACYLGEVPKHTVWNPLTDDGDALRLAVKLGLLVDSHGLHARVCFPYEAPLAHEPMGDDRCAATRRAIVRAAASLSKEERT